VLCNKGRGAVNVALKKKKTAASVVTLSQLSDFRKESVHILYASLPRAACHYRCPVSVKVSTALIPTNRSRPPSSSKINSIYEMTECNVHSLYNDKWLRNESGADNLSGFVSLTSSMYSLLSVKGYCFTWSHSRRMHTHTHTHTHTHSVGLLWTRDRLIADTYTW
jgi:hypothetical protein